MHTTNSVQVKKTQHSHLKEVDMVHLEFGKFVADHMLICDYDDGTWTAPQIVPFGNLSLSPTTLALHYGQTAFEGMKAFRWEDGRINIFRMERHYERFVKSLERMCMAIPPRSVFVEGLARLVDTDRDWVPSFPGTSLYIRPFMYASEAKFGVKVAEQYRFLIFSGPVPEVFNRPIRVKVETDYVRAARGGTGFAKCGGNYGGAFFPTQQARAAGFDQVLWTNGAADPLIEESGMMNVLFVLDNCLVTPPLSDSILDGVTRDSLLTLAKDLGIPVEERPVSVRELKDAFANKRITEAFGAGTAAVVAPIQTIHIDGADYSLPEYSHENIQFRLKDRLEQIRLGRAPDQHGWNFLV